MGFKRYGVFAIILALVFLFSSMWYDGFIEEKVMTSLIQTETNVQGVLEDYTLEKDSLLLYDELIPQLSQEQQVLANLINNVTFNPLMVNTEQELMNEMTNVSGIIRAIKYHNNKIMELAENIQNNQACIDQLCAADNLVKEAKMNRALLDQTTEGNWTFLLLIVRLRNTSIPNTVATLENQFNCQNAAQLTQQNICWQILFLDEHSRKILSVIHGIKVGEPNIFDKWQHFLRLSESISVLQQQNKEFGTIVSHAESTFMDFQDHLGIMHASTLTIKRNIQQTSFESLEPAITKIEDKLQYINALINQQKDQTRLLSLMYPEFTPQENFKNVAHTYYNKMFSLTSPAFERNKEDILLLNMHYLLELKEAGDRYFDQQFRLLDTDKKVWSGIIKSRAERDIRDYRLSFDRNLDRTLQSLYTHFKSKTNTSLDIVLQDNMRLLIKIQRHNITPSRTEIAGDVVRELINITAYGLTNDLTEHQIERLEPLAIMLTTIDPDQATLAGRILTYNDQDKFGREDIYMSILAYE